MLIEATDYLQSYKMPIIGLIQSLISNRILPIRKHGAERFGVIDVHDRAELHTFGIPRHHKWPGFLDIQHSFRGQSLIGDLQSQHLPNDKDIVCLFIDLK